MKNEWSARNRTGLILFFSLLLVCSIGYFLMNSKGSFKQYRRTVKERTKSAVYEQRFFFQVDTSFCHMDPLLSKDKLKVLMAQPFIFLGKGKQTEVYETLDSSYVLRYIALRKTGKKSTEKANDLLRRALLAWNEAREETGLVALAAAPKEMHLPPFLLLNSKGNLVKVDSEKGAFFLQKKAVPFKRALIEIMARKDMKKMDSLFSSFFALLASFRQKGIIDLDGALIRNGNLGVINGKVILLDIGKLEYCYNKQDQTRHDIKRLRPLHHWLLSYDAKAAELFIQHEEKYKIVK